MSRPNLFRLTFPALPASPRACALGQASSGLDICKLIPLQSMPTFKAVVDKIGCLPASRAIAMAEIQRLISPSSALTPAQVAAGVAPARAPAWAEILSTVGPGLIFDCICKQGGTPAAFVPAPKVAAWYDNPVVVAGIVVGGLLVASTLFRGGGGRGGRVVVVGGGGRGQGQD